MPYTFEAHQKDGYILLVASGTIESTKDLVLLSRALREKADEFDCRRFLIDERAVVKNIDSHDLTVFAEMKVDEPIKLRLAVIYSPEDLAEFRWMETIQQNRSIAYRQFSSFDEAEQWLLS